jgi:hypothetical protein
MIALFFSRSFGRPTARTETSKEANDLTLGRGPVRDRDITNLYQTVLLLASCAYDAPIPIIFWAARLGACVNIPVSIDEGRFWMLGVGNDLCVKRAVAT